LNLKLLGQIECRQPSGDLLNLSTRKSEALLAYLALAPGIRHSRDRLVNLLWSDRGEDQARNSLRQALSSLRKSLDQISPDLLDIERTTIRLNAENIDVDVLEFKLLVEETDLESLNKAANLYQGEFLEGMAIRDPACEQWLAEERDNLKRLYIDGLSRLSRLQLEDLDFNAAIQCAERLVVIDSLDETGWRMLISAYHQKGNRNHALMAYKRCCDVLQRELGVEPELATRELQRQILEGQIKAVEIKPDVTEDAISAGASITELPGQKSPPERLHNIAVLPFDNLSGDPEQEYFSDGITESIIINLSLFPGLLVKSRNSSFAFKEQIKSLGEISKELNVDYVVEGSIRKANDRIRITVQLIDAQSGNQIWGKRYDSDLSNLFDLEEELSRTIAATVTGQIESDLQRIAIAKGAAGQQAYDLLLSGTYHAYRFNRQDTVEAIEKLDQCLTQDADNVRAHVLLYVCHTMDYLDRWTLDHRASFKLAEIHILKALELGPEIGLVQTFYAEYLNFCGKLDEARFHFDKALAINPNDPDALAIKAYNLIVRGEFETALQTAESALQLDPYHPWVEWELAGAQYFLGDYETALETIRKFRTSPGFTQLYVVAANVKLGKIDLAREALLVFLQECRQTMLSMPQSLDEWLGYLRETYPFIDPQITQDLIDCLVQAGHEDCLIPESDESIEVPEHVSSIAVLPFDNLSGDPEQEYFSDGITESIILNLSLFPDLLVKSRNSSFAFKEQIKSLGEISKELNVDYVVEGSIRKSSARIRITVQLVDAQSGNQIWGNRFDSELEDIFELEAELSRTIAATVTGRIEFDLRQIALTKPAAHQKSYDLLLAGIYHSYKFTRDDMVTSREKLYQCLALDPDNVLAHAYLYFCHAMEWVERWTIDRQKSYKLAKQHSARALELNPDHVIVQAYYAEMMMFSREYEKALFHINKALELNPNEPEVYLEKSVIQSRAGDFDSAIESASICMRLDNYHPCAGWVLSEAYCNREKYDEAIDLILNSKDVPAHIKALLAVCYMNLGKETKARAAMKEFLHLANETMASRPKNKDEWLQYWEVCAPCDDAQMIADQFELLVQAGLCD